VTKNTLTKLALKDTSYENLADFLTGPTAIGYSEDPVAPAKILTEFAKTNENLKVLGGAFGTQKLDVKGVESLAKMPSLDELRAKIVGILSTPATRVAGVLQAPAGQLARVFGAYGAKS
jgi:large subunit ribosomal protein L10